MLWTGRARTGAPGIDREMMMVAVARKKKRAGIVRLCDPQTKVFLLKVPL